MHFVSKGTKHNELFLREAVKNTKSSAGLSGTGCWLGHLVLGDTGLVPESLCPTSIT